jgi:hypothetical protein
MARRKLVRKPDKQHKTADWNPVQNFGTKRKPWIKGQSGNPKGRPPTCRSIPDNLRLIGSQPVPKSVIEEMQREFPDENFQDMTYAQAVMFRVFRKALSGDENSLKFFAERTEGLLTQSMKINTNNRNTFDDKTKAMLAEKLAREPKLGND